MKTRFLIFLQNLTILSAVIALSLLFAEGACRIVFDPIDFLMPELESHEVLGVRIKANSAGHDPNGFRNKEVPSQADIVVLGDSQTYGVNAAMKANWPSVLSQKTGQGVYNMAMLASGPPSFEYILKEKGMNFRPKIVVVALYLGNDIFDAYRVVYASEYFKDLRDPGFSVAEVARPKTIVDVYSHEGRFLSGLRTWLAHNSILYRLVKNVVGDLYRSFEARNAVKKYSNVAYYDGEPTRIQTGFSPQWRMKQVDLESPQVQEGLRLTLQSFHRMNDLCRQQGIRFLAVIIPSKESVYEKYILRTDQLRDNATLMRALTNESRLFDLIEYDFKTYQIPYVSTLEKLQAELSRQQIYGKGLDDHPIAAGYKVIAQEVYRYLAQKGILKK